MEVTSRLLVSKGACADQVREFKLLFPKGTEVTEALCVAYADVFDWTWAAKHLLSQSAREEYNLAEASAWEEYGRTVAYTREEYGRIEGSAWEEYGRVIASTFGRLAQGQG